MKLRPLLLSLAALFMMQGMAQTPKVTTDTRFVRGATMAFGRIKSSLANGGSAIVKRGFCYAEHADPTINDSLNQAELNNKGIIYWMKGLKPATKYYMRAYAMNMDSVVGYGDVIKFYTTPMGNVRFSYNNGGNAEENKRINEALTQACWYFNNLIYTTRKFNVGYGSGTPTADCNYQPEPWMNVGPNSAYQRCGTIMHEMEHGLGLQNYLTQWSKGNLRTGNGSGNWTGDRANAAVRFWDNDNSAVLKGDGIHMWPYGINGAQEDNGSDVLYLGNAIICQGLGEDGLEHNESRHADPYYSLEQEDTTKFYLKNESTDYGRYTSFLVPTATGALEWRSMSPEEATQNDSAAWYFTFTPNNQYYQIRNAATGQYLTYSSGIKTAAKANLTTNENWHLMRGRVDADGQRGYWIIHPETGWSPHCLQAADNGKISSATFNIANSAETQRWLIMTLSQMLDLEKKAATAMKKDVSSQLSKMDALTKVGHQEEVEGADDQFKTAIADLKTRTKAATSTTELTAIVNEAQQLVITFLESTSLTDYGKPFDLSYMLVNPKLDNDTKGWSQSTTVNYNCAEFYQTTFDFNQTVNQLPLGTYKFCVQGFQRPGTSATSYNNYAAGRNNVNALVYAGNETEKLSHIASAAQETKVGIGNEATVGTTFYMPNDMQSAKGYFTKGLYENAVITSIEKSGSSMKMGIRSSSMPSNYWAIFYNFRLHYFGRATAEQLLGIKTIETFSALPANQSVYSLDGRRFNGNARLRPGIYVKNGKKMIVR